ncbi:MAG: DUF2752 domain-containing protein [Labilithrix sp.]|nr:DUF2752 domain-containing protein [Labilithrix sp.]MCW5810132.1 DUF2752 domain-containing protein [Labilithrix sp.]
MNAVARPVTASRRVLAVLAVAAVWVVVALPIVIPGFQCPTARLTHHPCPGCGMTRAVVFLLRGDVGASLAMHPLALPTLLTQGAFAAVTLALAWRRGAPWAALEERAGRVALYLFMAVMMLVFLLWIARGLGALGGPVPV